MNAQKLFTAMMLVMMWNGNFCLMYWKCYFIGTREFSNYSCLNCPCKLQEHFIFTLTIKYLISYFYRKIRIFLHLFVNVLSCICMCIERERHGYRYKDIKLINWWCLFFLISICNLKFQNVTVYLNVGIWKQLIMIILNDDFSKICIL